MKSVFENLKKYFRNNSEKQIMEDWLESKKYDEINSPTINEFNKQNTSMKDTQRTREPP